MDKHFDVIVVGAGNGYIHPCCAFPLSDVTIEVPPAAK